MSSEGSSGWEATSIGFTLVGCIGACSGLGYWLDGHFKTSFWLPLLFLVGVVAGFREMILVTGRINKEQARKKQKARDEAKLAPLPNQEETAKPMERERIFKVPPPPVAGEKPVVDSTAKEPESVDELIQRLLDEDKDDESDRS